MLCVIVPERLRRSADEGAPRRRASRFVWSAGSQALWSHTPAVLGYALAVWGVVSGFCAVAGVAAGLAAVARPATAPAALLLVGFLIHRAMRHRAAGGGAAGETGQAVNGVACLGLVGGLGVLFNLMVFGNVGGGAAGRTTNWVEAFGASNMFEGSLLTGLAGLTISPSRGSWCSHRLCSWLS